MTNSRDTHSANTSSSEGNGALLPETSLSPRVEPVPVDHEIRMRAYQFYLERGGESTDHLGDWLRAERDYHARPDQFMGNGSPQDLPGQ